MASGGQRQCNRHHHESHGTVLKDSHDWYLWNYSMATQLGNLILSGPIRSGWEREWANRQRHQNFTVVEMAQAPPGLKPTGNL